MRPLDAADVLARVEQLPLYTYNYIGQDPAVVNRGPVAQEWHALFPSGKDPLKIETMDLDGVALAAIQGLAARNRALEESLAALAARNGALEESNAALGIRVSAVEARLAALESESP